MSKIAIIGGYGMLGTELCKIFPHATNIPHNVVAVENITPAVIDGFSTVINCAAYHDVEKCENHPHRAFEVNFIGAHSLACACRQVDARLVHISTNMVFSGKKWTAYDPTDDPQPLSVYGYSKWMGECAIREQVEKGLKAKIIRLGPIYGHAPCRGKGRNFVTSVIEKAKNHDILSYPIDQTVNPLSAADAADYIDFLMETDDQTINHVGSDNSCSFYEFAREILHYEGLKIEITPSFTNNSLIKRPLNGLLKPSCKTCTWQNSLARYFNNRSEGA